MAMLLRMGLCFGRWVVSRGPFEGGVFHEREELHWSGNFIAIRIRVELLSDFFVVIDHTFQCTKGFLVKRNSERVLDVHQGFAGIFGNRTVHVR